MSDRPFQNVAQLLEARVSAAPERPFLLSLADGRVFTYADFHRAVARAAARLASLGAGRGDRVSLLLHNRVEYLVYYFACFRLGAWAGPVNGLLKSPEMAYVLNDSGAQVLVTQAEFAPAAAELRGLTGLRHIAYVEEPPPEAEDAPGTDVGRDDEAVIIYTSGTTGKPKGVLLTHGNLLVNAREIAAWLGLTADDRALMMMPLFHVNALMTTGLAALWAGASAVVAPRFSASRHWQTVADYGVTYFGSVATMLSLLNHTWPEGVPAGCDTSRLRFALCGSAPVPVEVLRQFEAQFGCPVVEGYGLSESTCRATFNPPDERRRPGSVGLPIGNEMKIFDDHDRELGPGEVGEIALRGANVMKGYYGNEAATRQAFRSGWFHTGDLGYRDADGFYYVVDRKSDMIIRGGENIYPREIDEALYQHPGVQDAATVGVPDPLYGEEVRSFVVLRDGEGATEEELIAWCRARLADYKCPKRIEFLDAIPKGPTGKLLKRELAMRGGTTDAHK